MKIRRDAPRCTTCCIGGALEAQRVVLYGIPFVGRWPESRLFLANMFLWVILSALLVDYAIDVLADLLNLRWLRVDLPKPLEGLYNAEQYRNSQRYVRTTTRFGIIKGTLQVAVLLIFWFSGGFEALDRLVRGWHLLPVFTGVAYLGIIAISYMVLTLPFSIYGTFVIEQRYGFNRTTRSVFLVDMAKGLALSVLLGVPLLAAVLAIFMYGGTFTWLYCWVTVTVVSLIIQFIAPTWIMPWFNKFKAMEPGELRDAIFKYAESVDYHLDNVFIMDGSKRSARSNAFFTGFGRNKRIVLFDTLIADHPVPELVAILAHEIGHYRKRHVMIGTVIAIAHTGVLFFLFSLFLRSSGLYQAFGVEQSVYAGLLFFGLLYTPIEMVLSFLLQAFSRHNEYQADRFAAATLDDSASLENALKKLSVKNLSNLLPHPFYVALNYSHPPLLQRIEAIRKIRRIEQ